MKVVGIIAEYNPFHKGHLYHINKIKSDFKADAVICVMSSNFVQRGEPAIFDKWARTKMALRGGIDLIIELPICYCTSTAEIFAESAVKTMAETKVVDTISFGIEEYGEKELMYLGNLLANEPHLLKHYIKYYLHKGLSFASAREKAVIKHSRLQNLSLDLNLISQILRKPNNILAVEYIKALNRLKTDISVYPVLRKGAEYHDTSIGNTYPSATGVRKAIEKYPTDYLKYISHALPSSSLEIIKEEIEQGRGPIFFKDLEKIIFYILRRLPVDKITSYFDVTEGLENRIKRAAKNSTTLEELINTIKSKRYPETKIQRILIHILLNIQKEVVAKRSPLYLRILGMSDKGSFILREITRKSSLPVLTRASDYKALSSDAKNMFELELLASDIYSLFYKNPEYQKAGWDFYRKILYNSSK